jgi:hypothetical protein
MNTYKYIVMMPNSWGKGDTLEEAEKIARKEGNHRNKKVKRKAWRYNTAQTPYAHIDENGSLCWTGERPEQIDL